jgi:type I restriction enzyme R subunit
MITEDQLEQLAIQWFQDTGWNYVNGKVISPEGEDFRAVELLKRLLKDNIKSQKRNKEGLHSAAR